MSIETENSSTIDQSMQSIQEILDNLPKYSNGRIAWPKINENPEEFQSIIQNIARAFIAEGNPLTQQGLRARGLTTVIKAAKRFYPNNLGGLRESIGLSPAGMSEFSSYGLTDTSIPRDNRGRIRWSILERDPERLMSFIESEIAGFLASGQRLTHKNLEAAGLGVLARGIQRYYPGDLTALEIKFETVSTITPRGYWESEGAIEDLKNQALEVLGQTGELSRKKFIQAGKGPLYSSIVKHYPGGWGGLTKDLGLNPIYKPEGYWTEETIEKEAMEFFVAEGALKGRVLQEKDRADLLGAIQQRYQGGMTRLRMNLGLALGKKNQYWTPEQIEIEAEQVYRETGAFSVVLLQKRGRADLIHAIATHYPGRIAALKEKLGVTSSALEVHPNEANLQLDKLIETTQD